MLNTKIKPFKTISYYNKNFNEFNYLNFKNKWNLLFFFPYSYTYICPTELKELSKLKKKFDEIKCNLYAISTDSHFTHKNWIENDIKFINFPFLSDFNHNISIKNNLFNKIDGTCYRSSIILDPNLIIKSIDIVDNNIGRNILDILNRIKMLQFTYYNKNKLCPFSWNNDKIAIDL